MVSVFPVTISAQTFYGDTLWTRDYSSSAAFSCAFSPDGSKLAISYECMGPMVRVLDVSNGYIVWESATPNLCLYNIQFSSNGQYIAIAEELGHLVVVDMTIPDTIYNIDTETGGLNAVDFSASGDLVYAGGNDGSIRIYETATGTLYHSIPDAHTDAVLSLDVSASGRYLVSGSKDNLVKVWDLQNNYQLVHTWNDPTDDVKSVKFTPDENRVLAGSVDDMIYAWHTAAGTLDTILMFHAGDVNSIDISTDGSFAVSGSNDQSVRMFDLYNYASVFTFTNQLQTRVYGVAISPQMDKLAASNHIGYVILYDIHALTGTASYEQESLKVYPNPATDHVFINGLEAPTSYQLVAMNGQVVQSGIISGNFLDVTGLQHGMYVLRIGNSYTKLIRQ